MSPLPLPLHDIDVPPDSPAVLLHYQSLLPGAGYSRKQPHRGFIKEFTENKYGTITSLYPFPLSAYVPVQREISASTSREMCAIVL